MSVRFEVILNEAEFAEIQSYAQLEGVTPSECATRTLRRQCRGLPRLRLEEKLRRALEIADHAFEGAAEDVLVPAAGTLIDDLELFAFAAVKE